MSDVFTAGSASKGLRKSMNLSYRVFSVLIFFFTIFTELVFLQLQMCLSKLFVCVCVCVAGLLLCYELPVQTDRDGRPIDRFLISRSRSYQQTLTALIHEVSLILFLLCLSHSVVLTKLLLVVFDVQVNIQPSEWHRALFLPQAWRGFMSRAFHAVLQVCASDS